MKLYRLIVVGLSLILASRVEAQVSFAVDASFNTGIGKGGEFKSDEVESIRVAASLTRRVNDRFSLFAELAADPVVNNGDKLVCVPSTRGGCAPRYPAFVSGSAILGVESGRGKSRVEVRAGVGGGAVGASGTLVGAIVSQADVGLFPVWHAGVVLGWRSMIIPRFKGDRLGVNAALIGIRLR